MQLPPWSNPGCPAAWRTCASTSRINRLKALVLEAYNRLIYQDVPDPDLEAGEALVRVRACGICGSDVKGLDGSTGRRVPPIIMGHEAAGEIVRLGAGVQGWSTGERVTFDCVVHCGTCYYCQRGLTNLCDQRRWIGVSTPTFRKHGALAEYVAVPQQVLHRLPDSLSFIRAATMEALSIAYHAVERTPFSLHDSAVVVGSGMIGLLIIQLLRLAGCSRILAVDLHRERVDLAVRLGAQAGLIWGQDDVPSVIRQWTDGRGADAGFDAVGVPSAFLTTIESVRKGGVVCMVGNFARTVDFPLQDVVLRQLSLFGAANASGGQQTCLDMLSSGAVQVDPLIGAVAPLVEGPIWFDRLAGGQSGLIKVILTPS
jgi:L-iditol 2-dehydrogenase